MDVKKIMKEPTRDLKFMLYLCYINLYERGNSGDVRSGLDTLVESRVSLYKT